MERREEVVDAVVREVGQRAVGTHPAGVRAAVPVEQALVVARQRERDRVRPSHRAMRLASRPDEPLLDDDPRRVRVRAARRPPAPRSRRSASAAESHTVTPLPAASPSALTTTPRAARCQLAREGDRPPMHP